MNRYFGADMDAFSDRVDTFIERYWPSAARIVSHADVQVWRAALVNAGWSVPQWPEHQGGTDWNPTQHYIWRRACSTYGVPDADEVGTNLVGPLLMAQGSAVQQELFLPEIAALKSWWCFGFMEPHAGAEVAAMTTTVFEKDGELRLNGCKNFVFDALRADFMCCLARRDDGFAFFLIDMRADGMLVKSTPTLDGQDTMAQVTFNDVMLMPASQIGLVRPGSEFERYQFSGVFSTLARSAQARAQLNILDRVISDFDPSDDIHRKRNDLAVDLSVLEALELRYLDALQRGVQVPFSLIVLRLKSRKILLQLGALQVESFGYYALPFADDALLHNEGPIGPVAAAASVRQSLTQQLSAIYEGSTEQLKDEAWRHLGHQK